MSAGLIQHYSSGVYKYKTNIPTLQDDIRCVKPGKCSCQPSRTNEKVLYFSARLGVKGS
jgi:hypothetical protein